MLLELLKNYADMINSATRMTQRSATAMARTMLIQAGMEPAADMVSKLSEQMIEAQDAHYAMMRRMVQAEVDMTVARMGALSTRRVAEEEVTSESASEQEESVATLTVVEGRDAPKAESAPADEPGESAKAEPEPPPLKSVSRTPGPVAKEDAAKEDTAKEEQAAKTEPAEAGGTAEQNADTTPTPTAKKAPAKRATARKTTARKTTARTSTAPNSTTATKSTTAAKSAGTGASAAKSAKSAKAAAKAPTKSTTTRSTRKASSSGDSTPEAQS